MHQIVPLGLGELGWYDLSQAVARVVADEPARRRRGGPRRSGRVDAGW